MTPARATRDWPRSVPSSATSPRTSPSTRSWRQRVLAMPNKRHTRRPVDFLNRDEVEALLQAPDLRTRPGRRDHTLLLVAVQTGLRASELIGLRRRDVQLGPGAHLRCHGKGRKERCTPLRKDAAAALRNWLEELRGEPDTPVFPNQRGGPLSHDGLDYLLAKHLAVARVACASLQKKRVTPHVLRHTAAMDLLQNGVDRAVIALWLRSRVRRDDLRLSACRSQAEGEGDGQDHPLAASVESIPPRRRGPGLSEQSVTIPSPMRHPTRAPHPRAIDSGIIRIPE